MNIQVFLHMYSQCNEFKQNNFIAYFAFLVINHTETPNSITFIP
jgi:hypothetical protein